MANTTSPNVRVYGPNFLVRVYCYGFALFFVAICVLFMGRSYQLHVRLDFGNTAPFALLPAFGYALCWVASYLRLQVSPEGVRARIPFHTVETSWNNVLGVHRESMEQGFVTREPMTGKGAERLAFWAYYRMNSSYYYSDEIRPVMRERRFLPLMFFSRHLKHGDFVAVVQRFAPHLPIAEIVPPPGPPPSRAERLTPWVFAAALLAAPIFLPKLIALALGQPLSGDHRAALGGAVAFGIASAWTFRTAWRRFRRHQAFWGVLLVPASVVLLAFALLSLAVGLER